MPSHSLSHAESSPGAYQVRVLDGPLRGTVHRLGARTNIGRASSSDFQIIAAGVSRQHAMIVHNEEGRYVLIDLSSANGTHVDGERIHRVALEPNCVFRIADTELTFEPCDPTAAPPTDAGAGAETGMLALRGTTQLSAHLPVRAAEPERRGEAGRVLAGEAGHPVLFDGPDGTEYGGQLIDEILEYRRLRSQWLRGGLASPTQRQRFGTLQKRLRQPPAPPPASERAFCRFDCWFPATLRFTSDEELSCWVRDFGVDGAQLKIEGHAIEPNSLVWLAMELRVDGRPRSDVLAARVAWADGDYLGLAFTGPPRSEDGRYTSGPAPREVIEETRPMRGAKPLSLVPED